jgi:hypothetical protein
LYDRDEHRKLNKRDLSDFIDLQLLVDKS